jgi:hypothetical protein
MELVSSPGDLAERSKVPGVLEIVQGPAAGFRVRVVACHEFLESLGEQTGDGFLSLDSQVSDFAEQPLWESKSDVLSV